MLKARKKNRVLRIPETRAEEYRNLGYTLIDEETGRVVYAPEDKDATIAALRKENAQLKQQIAEYELIKPKADISENKGKEKTVKAKTE